MPRAHLLKTLGTQRMLARDAFEAADDAFQDGWTLIAGHGFPSLAAMQHDDPAQEGEGASIESTHALAAMLCVRAANGFFSSRLSA
ncbi:hypothetical protein [Fulvimarina sp. MAC3]|uniref:hypothetical protein n=1 Tax=Fulvimarina sp. MAC3 TaxID=3148887 RepID=UPI0031FC9664